jgi:hypothetical protein
MIFLLIKQRGFSKKKKVSKRSATNLGSFPFRILSIFFILRDKDTKKVKIGSVVIDAELCSIDHDSMTRNCDQKGLKPLDAKTDSRTKLN